jgi:hypothetical protein
LRAPFPWLWLSLALTGTSWGAAAPDASCADCAIHGALASRTAAMAGTVRTGPRQVPAVPGRHHPVCDGQAFPFPERTPREQPVSWLLLPWEAVAPAAGRIRHGGGLGTRAGRHPPLAPLAQGCVLRI